MPISVASKFYRLSSYERIVIISDNYNSTETKIMGRLLNQAVIKSMHNNVSICKINYNLGLSN